MGQDNKTPSAIPNKILYIGEDLTFWNNVKKHFKQEYPSIIVEMIQDFKASMGEFQTLVPYVFEHKFKMVIIDFSKMSKETLHLARLIARIKGVARPVIFGLIDLNTEEHILPLAILSGCREVHVKSGEFEAIVDHMVAWTFFDQKKSHTFAKAALNDIVVACVPAKAAMISPKSIRIESDYSLKEDTEVNLFSFWTNKKILKSPRAKVISQSTEDLYYDFTYGQVLSFLHTPEINVSEDASPEVIAQKTQEAKELKTQSIEGLKNWVEKNKTTSRQKKLKVLVIDRNFSMYQDPELKEDYPFTLRCQPTLVDIRKEISQCKPGIIFFQMDDLPKPKDPAVVPLTNAIEEEPGTNNMVLLQSLAKEISAIEDYAPYIVVFNAKEVATDKIKGLINYKNTMALSSGIITSAVIQMAKTLETKLEKEGPQDAANNQVVYLDKNLPASYVEFEEQITLLSCSEMDLYFRSSTPLAIGTILKINNPQPMYITVANHAKDSLFPKDYYGLIHGIGEEKKQDLRRYINSVFFRQLEDKKKAEREEVEKTKKKAIEAMEKAKKDAEEKARQAAEEKARLEEEKKNQANQAAAPNAPDNSPPVEEKSEQTSDKSTKK